MNYTFFIAHAGADKPTAQHLAALLRAKTDVTVFLDCDSLAKGAQWDVEIPRAQRQSLVTVALISDSVDAAYYLREEVAHAIALERKGNGSHRLVPVFLGGTPSSVEKIPYGIRVKHRLDATALGLDGVASELLSMASSLPSRDERPASTQAQATAAPDRVRLYETICMLLPAQFSELIFRLRAPSHQMAPHTEPIAKRGLDLVQWAENDSGTGLSKLLSTIQQVAPGTI